MIKNFVLAAFLTLFATSPLWANGPSQQWRLEVTGTDEGVLEIAEIELRSQQGGANVLELFRNYTHEETDPAGSAAWSIVHDLGIQRKTASVEVIAFDVDVVAPGEMFYNSNKRVLKERSNLAYVEVAFEDYAAAPTGSEPTEPSVDDLFFDTTLGEFFKWDGAAWQAYVPADGDIFFELSLEEFSSWNDTLAQLDALTVTVENGALPEPNEIEPVSVANTDEAVFIPGPPTKNTGGRAANFVTELAFPEPVVGAASIRGATFDTPAANQPGVAVPVILGLERRPSAAAFDNNKGSWFKSRRAPTQRTPIAIQYTYWVGDKDRYPTVVEYSITAKNAETAPKSWFLMMYKDGRWVQLDQQAGIRFEKGETRVFSLSN